MLIVDKNFTGSLSTDINDYPEGLVLVIDKPYRWTSADVIRKVKYAAIRHFCKKNLKVGHAGTLDPLATGILLVCIGNACKNAEKLQASGKEYVAGVCFGATTPSYDMEKDVDRTFPLDGVNRDSLLAVLPSFIGPQEQIAPLFSAKQVDGVRAYELARKLFRQGKTLDEAAAELLRVGKIKISEMELLSYDADGSTNADAVPSEEGKSASNRINVASLPPHLPIATIRVACSKGTYIRALARDLGESLGSGAFLSNLQRSASGDFRVENAFSVDEIMNLLQTEA